MSQTIELETAKNGNYFFVLAEILTIANVVSGYNSLTNKIPTTVFGFYVRIRNVKDDTYIGGYETPEAAQAIRSKLVDAVTAYHEGRQAAMRI